jgi:inner membrane protein
MACAPTHRLVNFTATAVYLASRPQDRHQGFGHPLIGASATAFLASLPDLVEPAHHPHHRQFFHSLTFAAILGYAMYKAYEWQPETPAEKVLRTAALVSGSAYLLHLGVDFMTARSLPLI